MNKKQKLIILKDLWNNINLWVFDNLLEWEGIKFFDSKKDYGYYTDKKGIFLCLEQHNKFKNVKNTLAHEMCHQAQYQLIHKEIWKQEKYNNYHGITFLNFGRDIVQYFPELDITL